MTDIVGSILVGVGLVTLWATLNGIGIWFEGKWESYRYAKLKDKNLKFITHLLRTHKR
jgi:type IV secretory pathway TrbD component